MSSDFVHHMPIITDLIDYKPNVWDLSDQKENIAELHTSFGENRDMNQKERKHTPRHKVKIITNKEKP
jgi:hypothetical protein